MCSPHPPPLKKALGCQRLRCMFYSVCSRIAQKPAATSLGSGVSDCSAASGIVNASDATSLPVLPVAAAGLTTAASLLHSLLSSRLVAPLLADLLHQQQSLGGWSPRGAATTQTQPSGPLEPAWPGLLR